MIELISGYLFVVIGVMILLIPMYITLELLVIMFLFFASEETIRINTIVGRVKNKINPHDNYNTDSAINVSVLVTFIYWAIYHIGWLTSFCGCIAPIGTSFKDYNIGYLELLFNIGAWFSPGLVILTLSIGFFFLIRYSCRGYKLAQKAVSAVKVHEDKKHS